VCRVDGRGALPRLVATHVGQCAIGVGSPAPGRGQDHQVGAGPTPRIMLPERGRRQRRVVARPAAVTLVAGQVAAATWVQPEPSLLSHW